MNRLSALLLTLAVLTFPALAAKQNLTTRVKEADAACTDYLKATAKDPSSTEFTGDNTYELGFMLSRNHVFIHADLYGMNSYGARLLHHMACDVLCKQNQPCRVQEIADNGNIVE